MPTERDHQKVKHPLTPRILEDIGIINGFPPAQRAFKPEGDWSQNYRIWLCHGYYGLLNLYGGFLHIERKKGDIKGTFILLVIQKFINWEGILQTVTAKISCKNDDLSSPTHWEYSSEFRAADDSILSNLSLSHTGRIENNVAFTMSRVYIRKRGHRKV